VLAAVVAAIDRFNEARPWRHYEIVVGISRRST